MAMIARLAPPGNSLSMVAYPDYPTSIKSDRAHDETAVEADMPNRSERNRLRYAGRIPQETLDYLALKKRRDGRLRLLELPILVIVAVALIFLVMLLFQSHKPLFSSDSLLICVLILMLGNTLRRRIRSYVV
jgi:hypothetical protein